MAEQSRDPEAPKAEAEKKIPETVLLSAEELRAIAGGGGVYTPPPPGARTAVPAPTQQQPVS